MSDNGGKRFGKRDKSLLAIEAFRITRVICLAIGWLFQLLSPFPIHDDVRLCVLRVNYEYRYTKVADFVASRW